MKIGPTDGNQKISHPLARLNQNAGANDNIPPEDKLEISAYARARLLEAADLAMTEEDRSAGRLDLIRDKIAAGVYARPRIAETIADRLTDDLGE